MKKLFALMLALMMVFAMASALAETATEVWASEESPTGYYVTFRYPGDADRVRLQGQWTFASDRYSSAGTQYYQPEDWKPGYFVDGSFKVIEMAKNEDGVFEYTMPLPNGTFSYWYFIGGEEGAETADTKGATQVYDPAFPPMLSEGYDLTTLSAGSNRSHIYIPYAEDQLGEDRSVEAPRTDGVEGTILYAAVDVSIEDVVINVPFGIYLPYGFDAEREEPYKVFVLSHGGSGDEFNWPNNGCAKNILDNYTGLMEETVFVFPNSTIYNTAYKAGAGWDYEKIHTGIVDFILPYMVENYNVSEAVEDRAMGGLSMGGLTTTYMLLNYPDDFSEYYIISASSDMGTDEMDWETIGTKKIVTLGGWQAGDYRGILMARMMFEERDIAFDWYNYNGGHTWEIWRKALESIVANELWK